jgi:hypothetical protein
MTKANHVTGGAGTVPEAVPVLRARFNPEAGDYAEFGRRARPISRLMKRRTMTAAQRRVLSAFSSVTLLCLVLMLTSSLYLTFASDIKWGLGALFTGAILWALLAAQLAWGAVRRSLKEFEKDPRRGDEVVAEADEQSFRCASSWVRYELGWDAVAGVYTTRDTLFVFDRDRLTYVIPRRGFSSAEESEQFAKWVDGHAAFKP